MHNNMQHAWHVWLDFSWKWFVLKLHWFSTHLKYCRLASFLISVIFRFLTAPMETLFQILITSMSNLVANRNNQLQQLQRQKKQERQCQHTVAPTSKQNNYQANDRRGNGTINNQLVAAMETESGALLTLQASKQWQWLWQMWQMWQMQLIPNSFILTLMT